MVEVIEKVRTVAGSFVTAAVALSVFLSGVATLLVTYVDVPIVVKVASGLFALAGALSLAAKAVSKVTPVPPEVQGLEPRHPLDVAAAIKADYQNKQDFWSYR